MDWKINKPLSFILVGVGGQGTILASDLLAEVGLRLGYDVKKAEVHGMSQRGGSVVSNLRWAAQVYSPIVPRGTADVLVAFEKLEAVRFSDFLRPGGLALVNNFAIVPVTVNAAGSEYPEDDRLHEALRRITPHEEWVDGVALAEAAGNSRASNVVMICRTISCARQLKFVCLRGTLTSTNALIRPVVKQSREGNLTGKP
jgi:indolepyruvate ferredoxin oxidoreductase beta subunit